MPHDEAMIARAKSFESGAQAYEEFRPGYPDELFADVIDYASDRLAMGVLDIGAGTGRATIPLARRGLHVTAVEPAEEMAQILRSRAEESRVGEQVQVRIGTFEDLEGADGPFGLIVAAQSFHWTDPASRWHRLLDLLPASGAAAMFWNTWHLDLPAHQLDAVRRAYQRLAPALIADLPARDVHPWPADEIEATSGLVDTLEYSYGWTWTRPTADYVNLLSTTSQYAVTAESVRIELFSELQTLLGEQVRLQGTTRLHLMRKASSLDVLSS